MRKTLLIILLAFSYIANSQIVEKSDGLYYDTDNNIYSGEYVEYFENGNTKLRMNVLNGKLNGNVEKTMFSNLVLVV